MQPSSTRLICALAMVVGLPAVWLPVFALLEDSVLPPDELAILGANLLCALAFAAGWSRVWAPDVRWTKRREGGTWLVALGTILVTHGAAGGLMFVTNAEEEVALMAGLVWLPIWLVASATIWRESPAEQAQRVAPLVADRLRCLGCGYPLTGLREARCPECGAQYTLDQIVASVVGDAAAALATPAGTSADGPALRRTSPGGTKPVASATSPTAQTE